MKQRTRIRRIKVQVYPYYIRVARQRKWWIRAAAAFRKFRDAMREAYEKARRENEVSQVPEGRQESSAGEPAR